MIREDFTEIQHAMWSLGDYQRVADLLDPGAEALVEALAPVHGDQHLDVATGSGNVAVRSAVRGAEVHGIDLTAEFFPIARERAKHEGVLLELTRADATSLPFEDSSFDLVTSTYGIQFVDDHRAAAAEMARVCRSGGRLGMCNWTPSSWTAHFQEILTDYAASGTASQDQPMLWGRPDYLEDLFGDRFTITTDRRSLWYGFATAEDLVAFFESCFGPCIAARQMTEADGRWKRMRAELVEMSETFVRTDEATAGVPVEYLQVVAHKDADQ